MPISIDLFKTGKLVKLKKEFLEENKNDPSISECKFGIVLGAATSEDEILYKIYWFPINKIFYDDDWRIEAYEE